MNQNVQNLPNLIKNREIKIKTGIDKLTKLTTQRTGVGPVLQRVTKYKSNNGGFSAENQRVPATFRKAENLLYIFSVKAFIQSRYT
ncbi:hypothetical protein ACH3PA_00030 [Leeuwenhoekiella sp. A2]|uniref:hypothetical protein n=1 Tax=Leeuwenhoekiella sp. A2 TaxID=3141460 RepID=UPI003A803CD6